MLDDASAACILSLIYLVINLVAAAHQLSAAFMLVDVPTRTQPPQKIQPQEQNAVQSSSEP